VSWQPEPALFFPRPFREEYFEILEKNNVQFKDEYVFEFFDDVHGWD
jgi:hypothetical protein